MDLFYDNNRNRVASCTGSPHMTQVYERKLNMKIVMKMFYVEIKITNEMIGKINKSEKIRKLELTEENLNLTVEYLKKSMRYSKIKGFEFYLQNGFVFVYEESNEIKGIIAGFNNETLYKADILLGDSVEIAAALLENLITTLKENCIVCFWIPDTKLSYPFLEHFKFGLDRTKPTFTVNDSNLNCYYDNNYALSIAYL